MIGYVIGLTSAILPVIYFSGEHLIIFALVAVFVIVMILDCVWPILVNPLYNKFEPLENFKFKKVEGVGEGEERTIAEVKDAIDEQIKKLGVSIPKIVVMKTKRTLHSNAYVSGIWPYRKLVLYDNLLNNLKTEEVVAIVTHEIGHIKYKHTWINLFLTTAEYSLQIFFLTLCYGDEEIQR
jgi:STE24 endopeptidase